MGQKISLWSIVQNHKNKVLGTMFLLLLENSLFLIHPLLIGQAIDGALIKNYSSLWLMIGFYFLSIVIGTIRRMVDTRIYSEMHLSIAEKILSQDTEGGEFSSQQLSRVEMTADIMETINEDIPMFLESIIQVVGAFIILAQFRLSYFTASLGVFLVIVVIYTISTKKIYRLNRDLNNSYESYINSITKNKGKSFSKFFIRMNRKKIQLSDLESRIYAVLYLGILAVLVFVLLQEVENSLVTTGGIFTVLSYVLQFEEGIGELPYLYQKVVGTNEIINRLNEE